jgi:putative ABC transport system ATP-binding protein
MKKMNQDVGTTFIFSTHDQTIVSIADHVILLKDGLIVRNERTGRA